MIKLLNRNTKRVFPTHIIEITPGGLMIELYCGNSDGAGDADYYHDMPGDYGSIDFLGHFTTLKKASIALSNKISELDL